MKVLDYLILILALMGIFMILNDAEAHEPYWVLHVTDENLREDIFLRPYDRKIFCQEAKEVLDQYTRAIKLKAAVRCRELRELE